MPGEQHPLYELGFKDGRRAQTVADCKFVGEFIAGIKEEARSIMTRAKLSPNLSQDQLIEMKARIDGCYASVAVAASLMEAIAKVNGIDLEKEGLSMKVRKEEEKKDGQIISLK